MVQLGHTPGIFRNALSWYQSTSDQRVFSPLPRDDVETHQCQHVHVLNTGSFPAEHWCVQSSFPKKTGAGQHSPKAHSKL